MSEELRAIAWYLNDIADEIENGDMTEDDWCSDKLGIDSQIYKLKGIADEMSNKYD